MAVELEQKIMNEIGLGQHYSWYNGSGSCRYIREKAIEVLPQKMADNDLTISPKWLKHCRKASLVDAWGSRDYGLTNVWVQCSYAIQDGIYRQDGGDGFDPPEGEECWYFFREEDRQRWLAQEQKRRIMEARG